LPALREGGADFSITAFLIGGTADIREIITTSDNENLINFFSIKLF
jgi:hypothetical protein